MITFILAALGAISMIVFLIFRTKNGGIFPAMLKTITSLFFVATAATAVIENYSINGSTSVALLTSMAIVIIGLTCGLIGDLTLDLKVTYLNINIRQSDKYTFAGMSAFGVGHVMYIVAVSLLYGFSAWTLLTAVGATALIFGTSIFLMKMNFGKFIIPSITYGFLLTMFLSVTIAAGIISGFSTTIVMMIIGAGLFLLSDLVLSMTYFVGCDGRPMIIVNHVLYYAAQFLIAISLLYM